VAHSDCCFFALCTNILTYLLFVGDLDSHLIYGFLVARESARPLRPYPTLIGISVGSAIFKAQPTCVRLCAQHADIQTHRRATSVAIGSICALHAGDEA